MKKLRIFLGCFGALIAIAWIYLDIIELQSVYWLAVELISFFVIVVGFLFIALNKKENNTLFDIFKICFSLLFLGYLVHLDVVKYKRNACQDKFGREFNERRRSLGIPEIPANWQVNYRSDRVVSWMGKNGINGHERKYIYVDSCIINSEWDRYHLKAIHSISRDMTITTTYAKGKGMDSIFYRYETGSDSRLITRKQADSIFDSEKIKKDY